LESILKENNVKHIDYLSIDTEGNEIRVLESINFNDVFIKVISAENNENSNDVREFLTSKGFKLLAKVCGDDIYINISK